MNYQQLLQEAQALAIKENKEESAAILLLEHLCDLKSNELYLKIHHPDRKSVV